MKYILLIAFFSILTFSSFAQDSLKQDTTNITQFEQNIDSLINNWYDEQAQNKFFDNFEIDDSSVVEIPILSDSLYEVRLNNIESLVALPYNPIVKNFIELYTVKRRKQVQIMLGLSEYYFPIFEEVLDMKGLPLDLKYLPVIESALNPKAVSRVGATGLWQFMYRTGRMYNLKTTSFIDDRKDPVKATYAAAHFMTDLYKMFDDWTLVLAAYNCGPGNVRKAIRRAGGKTDYWEIYRYLPRETRGYVPAFIAATYAMHYHKEHNIVPIKVEMPLAIDTIMVNKRIHFKQLAAVLDIDLKEIKTLNPQYKIDIIPATIKSYPIKLPIECSMKYLELEDSIYNYNRADYFTIPKDGEETVNFAQSEEVEVRYSVKSGDNLGFIGSWYNVGVSQIKLWNNLRSNKLRIGQRLSIYVPKAKYSHYKKINTLSSAEKRRLSNKTTVSNTEPSSTKKTQTAYSKDAKYINYTVQHGDTLWDIAKLFNVNYKEIMEKNNISTVKSLRKGQVLKIRKIS